jgi:lipopolysaccharide/colanic/teichoic acid biosynthesis glycosyltransferase
MTTTAQKVNHRKIDFAPRGKRNATFFRSTRQSPFDDLPWLIVRYLASYSASFTHCSRHFIRKLLKRLVDIFGAFTLVVLFSPLMFLVFLAIVIADGFPIFFVHRRVGKDGRLFKVIKFRTMRRDAELIEKKAHQHKTEETAKNFIDPDHYIIRKLQQTLLLFSHGPKYPKDPRIIRFGAFIRKYSLDELPQLFNILNGTMSFIGPRPFVTFEVSNYSRRDQSRHQVRPGLSGPWQISDRDSLTRFESIGLDLKYISEQNFRIDFEIMLLTIPAAFKNRGGN